MADRDASAKLRIYHTIYRLNLSFANIVAHCRTLGESGVIGPKDTRLYQSYAQELQAEINEDVMSAMDEAESHDQFRFGKARLAREKELRDPDDVFIHAEERRRELARQGKKPPSLKSRKTLRSQSGIARNTKRSLSQSASKRLRR
jgi:Na+-translocating ferredoxin:NAD+ oxidoreductase RnfC subunit